MRWSDGLRGLEYQRCKRGLVASGVRLSRHRCRYSSSLASSILSAHNASDSIRHAYSTVRYCAGRYMHSGKCSAAVWYLSDCLSVYHVLFSDVNTHMVNYTVFQKTSPFLLFSDINVPQGSVATLVRCGGIFSANLIANFLTSQPVKEL